MDERTEHVHFQDPARADGQRKCAGQRLGGCATEQFRHQRAGERTACGWLGG